jgi:ABC-type phosphate/phosphonate transport system substrate-binding protein
MTGTLNSVDNEVRESESGQAATEAACLAPDGKRKRATHRPLASWVMACVLLLPAAVWVAESPAESSAQNFIASNLTVGFSEQSFAGVNRIDAEAAFKAYLVSVGRQRGYDLAARTQIFQSVSDFEAAIRGSKLQLSIIPSWDYIAMDIQDFADPYFVPVTEDGILESCLLLTQRGSGLNSFADLRGKSVAVLGSADAYMSEKWMETVLSQEKLGTPETFFGRMEKVTKASSAVLPVFFGKNHACVVNQAAFDVMKELNPQVGERLQIAEASEPLLSAVICLSKSGWMSAQHKEDMRLGLAGLPTGQAGQQILTLFRVRRVAPFKPEYLDSMKKLKATHDRFGKQAARVK